MSVIHLHRPLIVACGTALLVTGGASAQPAQPVAKAPKQEVRIQRDADWVDLRDGNRELNEWRRAEQAKLREQGRATAEEFRKIDQEVTKRARWAEANRNQALESLSQKAGVTIEQGAGGTKPSAAGGRGTFSDIDTRSMTPKEYQQVLEAAKKAGYKVKAKGDSFTIQEIDTTVHRQAPGETAQIGSSARDTEIGRGQNKETAMGLGRKDPAISVADNLKKAAHTLNTNPATVDPAAEPEFLQQLGKMTGRNMDATAAVAEATGKPAKLDAATRSQADLLKQGYSPEAAGIVRDNATLEQRAQDIADFQRRAKEATFEAVRAADTHANAQMDRLASEARTANDALETAKASGDPAKVAEAQVKVEAANKAVIDYHQVRTGADAAAAANNADAPRIVNEARGVSNDGRSPSEIRENALGPERKALTQAAADPTTSPKARNAAESSVSEPAKGAGAAEGGVRATATKTANAALGLYSAYQGVMRGSEEAGKEAAEGGDGAVKSAAKTVGYSAWYGLGIGGALESGKKAGEESAKQWERDVKAGTVDPTSRLSQAWAHLRGVGWGIAELTGLQAVKDLTVESAGGVRDEYVKYQAEKAEAEMRAARDAKLAEKSAAAATNVQAADKTKTPTGVTTTVDKPVTDKASADKAAADKASTDKAVTDRTAADKAAADKVAADKTTSKESWQRIGAAVGALGASSLKEPPTPPKPEATSKDNWNRIGGAIGALGASSLKEPPTPPKPDSQQAALTPAPAPPAPTTTEVEGGYVKDKNGATKVVYINDANGNRIGGYYVKYDLNGREIGRQNFTEKPAEPAAANLSLEGVYAGRITGGSSGSLRITVQGGRVNGTIGGSHQGDPITASFAASLGPDGSFSAPANGTLRAVMGDGKVSSYGFTGTVSGRFNGQSGSGKWSGGNNWGKSKGAWQAAK